VNAIWIVVGLGLAAAIVAVISSWRRRDRPADLGTVSHQWITENRLGPGQDSRR
jgi:hypothetical protein